MVVVCSDFQLHPGVALESADAAGKDMKEAYRQIAQLLMELPHHFIP